MDAYRTDYRIVSIESKMNLYVKAVLMIMTFASAQIVSKCPGFTQFEIQTCTGRRRYAAALGTTRIIMEKCTKSNCRCCAI